IGLICNLTLTHSRKETIMARPTLPNMNGNSSTPLIEWRTLHSYYAEVPALALDEQSRLIEQAILFAFDTLGVRYLDVRVCGTDTESPGRMDILRRPGHIDRWYSN